MKIFWCDEINERTNKKLARMELGERRVNALRRRFKEANQRVDKAIDRYKKFIWRLWIECSAGTLVDAFEVACYCRGNGEGWALREFVTDFSEDIFRAARYGEKRLVEVGGGRVKVKRVKRVDVAAVKKLEAKIDAAVDERERLMNELDSIGVDVWNDTELWQ